MANEKFTPGPWDWDGNVWTYDPEEEAPWLIGGDTAVLRGSIICDNPANARLIAAAPKLYEALQLCVSQIEALCSEGDVPDEARIILAKAVTP
jgi:hypothetical protein